MRLKLHQRQNGDVTVVELEGSLILGAETDALREMVRKLIKSRRVKIVLHLQQVSRLDSIGVGTMMDAVKWARRAGGDVCLLQLSKRVQDVLNLLGLAQRPELLRICSDEQAAVDSFRLAAPG